MDTDESLSSPQQHSTRPAGNPQLALVSFEELKAQPLRTNKRPVSPPILAIGRGKDRSKYLDGSFAKKSSLLGGDRHRGKLLNPCISRVSLMEMGVLLRAESIGSDETGTSSEALDSPWSVSGLSKTSNVEDDKIRMPRVGLLSPTGVLEARLSITGQKTLQKPSLFGRASKHMSCNCRHFPPPIILAGLAVLFFLFILLAFFLYPRQPTFELRRHVPAANIHQMSNVTSAASLNVTSHLQGLVYNPNWYGVTVKGAEIRAYWVTLAPAEKTTKILLGMGRLEEEFKLDGGGKGPVNMTLSAVYAADPSIDLLYQDFFARCLDPEDGSRTMQIMYEIEINARALGIPRNSAIASARQVPCPLTPEEMLATFPQIPIRTSPSAS